MSDLNIKENAKTLLTMIQDDDIHDGQAFYMLYNAIQNQTDDEAAKEFCGRFDNPLEAIGIVMRETGIAFDKGVDCTLILKDLQVISAFDDMIEGENILNTLKEGKDGS